jgi:hypothetical protein
VVLARVPSVHSLLPGLSASEYLWLLLAFNFKAKRFSLLLAERLFVACRGLSPVQCFQLYILLCLMTLCCCCCTLFSCLFLLLSLFLDKFTHLVPSSTGPMQTSPSGGWHPLHGRGLSRCPHHRTADPAWTPEHGEQSKFLSLGRKFLGHCVTQGMCPR